MAKCSPIWDYFVVKEDSRFVECNKCHLSISRGGTTTKTFNTSNLIQHLRSKHINDFKKYEEAQEEKSAQRKESNQRKQLTLEVMQDRVKMWSGSDPRAKKLTYRVAEMVALDCQPLSIVEDTGFIRLMTEIEPQYVVPSRKHITDVILPSIMSGVTEEVVKELSSVQWYSFTTDIWSTEVSNDSLLSFTVHWLSEVFEKKEAVLHAHPLPGSHTGEMLCREYNTMLSNWNIDNEQVHLIVRDNASNMVKAMSDGDFEDLGCFAHTLQLVINDGILSQRVVIDLLAIC